MESKNTTQLSLIVESALNGGSGAEWQGQNAKRWQQFRVMGELLKSGIYDAPSEVLSRAKSIVPTRVRKSLSVSIVANTFGLAGARMETGQETQVLLMADGIPVRLMYGKIPTGWQVRGRIESSGWTAECAGVEVDCEADGLFTFEIAEGQSSEVFMRSPNSQFLIPGIGGLLKGERELD